jgi:hypothetical protein
MPASGSEASLRNASEAELAVANDRLRHVLSFLGRMQNDGCREVAARTLRTEMGCCISKSRATVRQRLPGPASSSRSRKRHTETAAGNSRAHLSIHCSGLRNAEAKDDVRMLECAEAGM